MSAIKTFRASAYAGDSGGYTSAAYGPGDAELSGFQLREVGVTAYCRIPIANTGFSITEISGKLTLTSSSTRVEASMRIQSDLRLGPIVVAEAKATAYLETNPFEIGLTGAAYVFSQRMADASISLGTGGFDAQLNVTMFIVRGKLHVAAWSDYRGFNFTGSAWLKIGADKGEFGRKCLSDLNPFAATSSTQTLSMTTLSATSPMAVGSGAEIAFGWPKISIPNPVKAISDGAKAVGNAAKAGFNAAKSFVTNPCVDIPPVSLSTTALGRSWEVPEITWNSLGIEVQEGVQYPRQEHCSWYLCRSSGIY